MWYRTAFYFLHEFTVKRHYVYVNRFPDLKSEISITMRCKTQLLKLNSVHHNRFCSLKAKHLHLVTLMHDKIIWRFLSRKKLHSPRPKSCPHIIYSRLPSQPKLFAVTIITHENRAGFFFRQGVRFHIANTRITSNFFHKSIG